VSVFADGEIAMTETLRWGWHAGFAASAVWDEGSQHQVLSRQLQSARDAGVLVDLPFCLHSLGFVTAWCGDLALAGSLIAEAEAIAEATGTRLARTAAALLAGLRGKEAEASALIEVERRNAAAAGLGLGLQIFQWASGILYNGLGRYEQALVKAQRASEPAGARHLRVCAR